MALHAGYNRKILVNFQRTTGLFSSMLWTKLFCVVFLGLSCLGTKGVKDEKITWGMIYSALAVAFVLFFLNWWVLFLPISAVGAAYTLHLLFVLRLYLPIDGWSVDESFAQNFYRTTIKSSSKAPSS